MRGELVPSTPTGCEVANDPSLPGSTRGSPEEIKAQARKAYRRFCDDPHHAGLRFKKAAGSMDVYSVRITRDYRAPGVVDQDEVVWFWIGSHSDYDRLLP